MRDSEIDWSDRIGWPSNRMEPETVAAGGSRRSSASDVADLPEPDSPTRPTVWPGAMVKEIPSTTRLEPKVMVRLST